MGTEFWWFIQYQCSRLIGVMQRSPTFTSCDAQKPPTEYTLVVWYWHFERL